MARGEPDSRLRIIGWTDDMPGWMTASDVVVTNGGGATALEAVVSGHPVVMFDPIGGHGRANAALMTSAGLAWLAGSPAALTGAIRGLALVQPLLVCDLLLTVLIPLMLRHRRVRVAGRMTGGIIALAHRAPQAARQVFKPPSRRSEQPAIDRSTI